MLTCYMLTRNMLTRNMLTFDVNKVQIKDNTGLIIDETHHMTTVTIDTWSTALSSP